MEPKTQKIEKHREYDIYAASLLSEIQKAGIKLTVVGETGLRVQGEVSPEQRESIRIWKRHLINALSPKCEVCTLPMKLIDDGKTWFCPFGCTSQEVK